MSKKESLEIVMENKIFLDTHILVDIFLDRQPFSEYAIQLISQAEKNQWHLHCSVLTLANLIYILRKNKESDQLKALDIIKQRIKIYMANIMVCFRMHKINIIIMNVFIY